VGIGTSSPKARLSFGTDLFTPRKIALWDGINDFYGFGIEFGFSLTVGRGLLTANPHHYVVIFEKS